MTVLSTMPFISVDATLIAQLLNTAILFLLLRKFLFKPVSGMIAAREAEVAKMYEDADADREAAQKLKDEYTESLSGARQEAETIVRTATQRAQVRSDEMLAEARSEVAMLRERAARDIEQEKKKAMNELRGEISDIAVMVATKVIEKDINQKDHEALIESFIENVGDASWQA